MGLRRRTAPSRLRLSFLALAFLIAAGIVGFAALLVFYHGSEELDASLSVTSRTTSYKQKEFDLINRTSSAERAKVIESLDRGYLQDLASKNGDSKPNLRKWARSTNTASVVLLLHFVTDLFRASRRRLSSFRETDGERRRPSLGAKARSPCCRVQ